MSSNTVISDPTPLNPNYLPSKFVDRTQEEAQIQSTIANIGEACPRHLFISGPRGTGKTHLVLKQLDQLVDSVTTCYIPCNQHNTQYKALKRLYETVTDEEIHSGHHTAELKREIDNRTTHIDVVIILDELDFLLLNDGDDLLYYLSRTNELSTILISGNQSSLDDCIEERTRSSLQPETIPFEPYSADELYQIFHSRIQKALAPQSLQQEALSYIASTIQNPAVGLQWIRTAAENAEDAITESTVRETRTTALQVYTDSLLDSFSEHHRLLYQGIKELTREHDSSIHTGPIYDRYKELCNSYDEEALSNRRISDLLKHLELLNLIEADYHYGGRKGKTRDIRLDIGTTTG